MEEIKEENMLNLCKGKDLDEYLKSVQGKVKEMFRELESKDVQSSLTGIIAEINCVKQKFQDSFKKAYKLKMRSKSVVHGHMKK
ncbi:hypothetical protein Bca52824_022870 [Brassica carinata]|uniref:Uncharacterized protein n=1 Tax=Brassica carinata TaxID=52824 RepID=A0A8X7VGS2_BRACI|nr:hypothetical protein Bca52824_022870 [Brassica carinata]